MPYEFNSNKTHFPIPEEILKLQHIGEMGRIDHVQPYSHFFDDILICEVQQLGDIARYGNYGPEKCIFGVRKGKILWELNKENYLKLKHAFTKPYLDKNRNLWVQNLNGQHYKIDRETGDVLEIEYEGIDYEVKDNILKTGKKDVVFNSTIRQILVYKNLLIVLLNTDNSDGVFCVSKEGKVLWNIREANVLENVPLTGPSVGPGIIQRDERFVSLAVSKNDNDYNSAGDLWAYQWGDVLYRVDHKTGRILETKVWR